ncbi:hypothetical protein SUGI_1101580 [Cryptomeria japonica]|nr:hypothetical protein SUGI_1101580 [Cryptomeria japonica]
MALQFFGQLNHQDRGFDRHDVGFPSTTSRAPPSQNKPWQMVKSRRVVRAERRREARASMDLSNVWVIPITSRILGCATKANRIPLGTRVVAFGPCQPLQRPLHNSQPHLNHAEGFIKPTGVGGVALPKRCHKLRNIKPTPVVRSSLNHVNNYAPKARSSQYSLKSVTPNLECIKISTPSVALKLRNYYEEHGLFAKWHGNDQPLAEIANWWKDTFKGQVSITALANNFLYIECYKKSLKTKLLYEEYVFDNGVNFKFIGWHSEFDANKFEFKSTSKWIEIHNVPVELMHAKILIEIGDKLGKFIVVEANWLEKYDIKILIEVDNSMNNLKNISLDTVDGNYILSPVWYHGPVSENLSFYKRVNPSTQKPQAPKPDRHKESFNRIDIQFNNDIGSFIINVNLQEVNNHATPPDLRAGNNPNRTDHNYESLECRHEDQIQKELSNVIDNLMRKLVEEFVEEVYNDAQADIATNITNLIRL